MKPHIIIILACFIVPNIIIGQSNIKKVWLTELKGDSLIQEKYLYELTTTTKEYNSRILFEPNRDTCETVITYYNKNGQDSIELWKYPNQTDSWTLHWIYNKENQLVAHYTTLGNMTNSDTIIYEYDKYGQLIKETRLYENFFMFDSTIYNNGKIVLKLRKDQDQILSREAYSYNNNGELIRIVSLNENDKKVGKIIYKYDSKDRLSEFKIINLRPKQIVKITKCKYNNQGKTIEYKEIDNNYHTNRTYNYKYDQSGEKVKSIAIDNINGVKRIFEIKNIKPGL